MAAPKSMVILEEHGLALAPRGRRRAFWQSYNSTWRHRRIQPLGDLAARVMSGEGRPRFAPPPPELLAAWREALPAEYAGQTRVEGWVGGVVTVAVASAAARYALERVLGDALLQDLRRVMGRGRIRRIVVRLAKEDSGSPE